MDWNSRRNRRGPAKDCGAPARCDQTHIAGAGNKDPLEILTTTKLEQRQADQPRRFKYKLILAFPANLNLSYTVIPLYHDRFEKKRSWS